MIGILGGTFDPVHNGHLHVASTCYDLLDLEKIIFLPCYQNILKMKTKASGEQRLTMLALALSEYPHFQIDQRDINLGKINSTFKSLTNFRNEYNKEPLCFLMSSDTFEKFDRWQHWQQILKVVHLLIIPRPNFIVHYDEKIQTLIQKHQTSNIRDLQTTDSGFLYFMDITNQMNITATKIRRLRSNNKSIKSLVPTSVEEYIKQEKLYI